MQYNMPTMRKKYIVLLLAIVLFALACARPPATSPERALEPLGWWRAGIKADDMQFAGLSDAVRGSLDYYRKVPQDTQFIFGSERRSAGHLAAALEQFLAIIEDGGLSPRQKLTRIKDEFALFRSVGSDGWGTALFTGYYEPIISCRLARDDAFRYPLYKRPDDIIEVDLSQFGENFSKSRIFGRLNGKALIPYYSRQEIDRQQALEGKGLEALWCSDPVDIYLLQVQGSGKADLGNGSMVSVLYNGQNGRPYRSIGKYLIDTGVIAKEQMSMQAIRDYLRSNPEKVIEVLNQNPSYVFFRIDTSPSVGNIGVPLTPARSIATDARLFPKGALALIQTEKPVIAPDGSITAWVPFTRFVTNQDTGGAIRGPGRVDLFWGQGSEAEISAGYMKQEGRLYFILPRR